MNHPLDPDKAILLKETAITTKIPYCIARNIDGNKFDELTSK